MKAAKSNQILFDQANHSAGDSISLGNKVLAYTVKCHPASTANLWVGLSEDASEGNLLEPGESLTVQMTIPGYYLADQLYVTFDPAASGGRGLVIVLRDTGEEIC
jgi:hypothetical protein